MKILIIHATAGAGHKVAAKSIYDGIKTKEGVDAVFVDALDYTNRVFRFTYPETYEFLVTKIPFVWKFFFQLLDIPSLQKAIRIARRIYNKTNAFKLERYLKNEQFDAIVCTQFLSVEVAGAMKRKGVIQSKLYVVVTDYDVHRIWLSDQADGYFCASDYTQRKLVELGVAEDKIYRTGIPVHERFTRDYDLPVLKTQLGLQQDRLTVLIATGSFGMGPIAELIERLPDVQMLVVCGHNQSLYKRLKEKNSDTIKIYSYVSNMHELMAVADVMITKPGGLSITEALVSDLPLIFFSAIPGQEANNVKVLKTFGIGMSNCSLDEIAAAIEEFRQNPQKLEEARHKIRQVAQPNAVEDIASVLLAK